MWIITVPDIESIKMALETKMDKNLVLLKFIYSEKAIEFCEISTLLLSYIIPVKSKVAFSEYMNFKTWIKRHLSSLLSSMFFYKNLLFDNDIAKKFAQLISLCNAENTVWTTICLKHIARIWLFWWRWIGQCCHHSEELRGNTFRRARPGRRYWSPILIIQIEPIPSLWVEGVSWFSVNFNEENCD